MTELSPAQQFVNQVFDTEVPSDTRFFIKADMELLPGDHTVNWVPLPGRESDVWSLDEIEPSDWCGEDQMVKACGVTHHSVTIDELYQFCQANNLEDERCWSTANGGMLTEHGLHIAANHMAESMDWNVGGITPVFVAVAWISPIY